MTTAAGAAVILLTLACYRRQDAMENMFLSSILLMLGGISLPDFSVFFALLWWAVAELKAANVRTYMASLTGIALVGLYMFLAWYFLPDNKLLPFMEERIADALNRTFFTDVTPIWAMAVSGATAVLGLWAGVAHLRKYSEANVRIQTRVQILLPVWIVSLLSFVCPTASGESLMALLWSSSLYLAVLYVLTYGFPRLPSFSRHDPYRRSFSKTSRRRRR